MLHRALLLATSATLLVAQDETAGRIDELLKQWNKPAIPGAAVSVIREGKLVFLKGYRTANLEYGDPQLKDLFVNQSNLKLLPAAVT